MGFAALRDFVARDGLALSNNLSMDKLLHNSVTILHFEFFKLLIDNGAQLTARRNENNLFHRLAELPPQLIEGKYEDFCKILELVSQKPLQVDAVNGKNETPAFIALINKNTKVLEKLIELGATLDTAFLKAAYAEKETSYEVKYLLLLLENRSLKLENRLLRAELKTVENEVPLTQSNVGSSSLKFN